MLLYQGCLVKNKCDYGLLKLGDMASMLKKKDACNFAYAAEAFNCTPWSEGINWD